MKLTLTSGGGFVGLAKQHSIDTNALDNKTNKALMDYVQSVVSRPPQNVSEQWSLDDQHNVPIDTAKMKPELLNLYKDMQAKLSYVKNTK